MRRPTRGKLSGRPKPFYVDWTDPGTLQRKRSFYERAGERDREFDTLSADLQRGEYISDRHKRKLFDYWADKWWRGPARQLAPRTRRTYWQKLELHIRPYFTGWHLVDISFSDVDDFIADMLEKKLGNKTIKELLSIISGIMRCAINSGPDAPRRDNPALSHENLKVHRRRLREGDMLDVIQAVIFISQVTDWYKAAVHLALHLGVRPAELWGLRIRDVDWKRCKVNIDQTSYTVAAFDGNPRERVNGPVKEDSNRTVPITHELIEELEAMLVAQGRPRQWCQPDDKVFLNKEGRPVDADTFQHKIMKPAITRALAKAKEHGVEFPDTFTRAYHMRHSCVTMAIDDGADILVLADRFGHDPAVMLRTYGHLQKGAQQRVSDRMAERYDEARATLAGNIVPFEGRRPKEAK